jgi:cytochrome c553
MKLYYLKWLLTLLLYSGIIFSDGNVQTGEGKSIICSACHGPDGVSINQMWPNLAGQHTKYLIKELQDFKQGKSRNEPTMKAMVANLTDQDIEDIAAFYSAKPIANGKTAAKYVARGEGIYRRGDMKKRITACIACHGPDGKGNAIAGFPSLSGQNPLYTISQLKAFKNNTRTNDISSIMHDISGHMSDEDMEAVANYILGLH